MTASTGLTACRGTVAGEMALQGQLLGLAEIAEKFGVERNTAWRWSKRSDFPEPAARLSAGPVWQLADVEAWGTEKRPNPAGGRPPKHSA